MNKNGVAAALRSLAAGEKSESETARLRDVFEDIEAALAAGVSRAAILEELHTQGFTLSLKGFESALYRLRKKKQTSNDGVSNIENPNRAHAPVNEKTVAPPRIDSNKETQTPEKKKTPSDLKKIIRDGRNKDIDLDDLA